MSGEKQTESQAIADEQLAQIPLFDRLSIEERRQLAGISSLHEASVGKVLVRQGHQSRRIWILLDGVCEVARSVDPKDNRSKQFVLADLQPFDHFGEMSFFEPHPHSASVRAKTPATLMRIGYDDYQELIDGECQSAFKLTYNIVSCLATRLRRMDDWVAQLLAEDAAEATNNQPPSKQSEWSVFRDKLFGEWSV